MSRAIGLLLLLFSVTSWTVMAGKLIDLLRIRRCHGRALAAFWEADSLPAALAALGREDKSGILMHMATAGSEAAQRRERGGMAVAEVSESVTRALRRQLTEAQAGIESGLTFLASVGSTAPFIGLFGTVWGIHHALVNLAGSSHVVLDKVAAPVGEALIMTAAGLFVAIPAVLAYNACVRCNRLTLARLDGFAHDLHAYLTHGDRARQA